MICSWLPSSVVLLAMLAFGPDEGPRGPAFSDPEARQHFEAAAAHFRAQDFAAASEELRLAYAREAVAELLYARAQAERRLERWASAATLYADYIATDPPREQADNARGPLLFCRAKAEQEEGNCTEARSMFESYLQVYPATADAELAREGLAACEPPAAVPPDESRVPEAAAVGPTAPDDAQADAGAAADQARPTRRPWHRDVAGAALVGSGLGIAAAGTGVALAGRMAFAQGQAAAGHTEAVAGMRRGVQLERVGIGIAAAGAVVAVVGISRWIAVGVRNRRAARPLRRGAAGVAVAWPIRW